MEVIQAENPISSYAEEMGDDRELPWEKERFEALCKNLGYHPTPAKAFSTAWPFQEQNVADNATYAEFRQAGKGHPMSEMSGKGLLAVIYTDVEMFYHGGGNYHIRRHWFDLKKPNIVFLDFGYLVSARKGISDTNKAKLKRRALLPLPADLTVIPNLGIDIEKATFALNRVIVFKTTVDNKGFTNVNGTDASGRIRVNFKCFAGTVIAASIAVPPLEDKPDKNIYALRTAVLLRFLHNIIPAINWDDFERSPIPHVLAEMARNPQMQWSQMFDRKFVTANREMRPDLISIGVMPAEFANQPYDIGDF